MIARIGRSITIVPLLGLLGACVSNSPSASPDFIAERDAARSYIVSDVANQASDAAVAEIRAAGNEADRVLVDGYLEDPAHARQLPAKYQDYLIEVFDPAEIEAMRAWDGEPTAFAQQVDVHRFVLAQSLVEWHINQAGLEGPTIFEDHLVSTLTAVILATPDQLLPPSRLAAAGYID